MAIWNQVLSRNLLMIKGIKFCPEINYDKRSQVLSRNLLMIKKESSLSRNLLMIKSHLIYDVKKSSRSFEISIFLTIYFISSVSDCALKPGLTVIKLFSCSTQLSMTFMLLIDAKMPTLNIYQQD